MHDRVLLKVMGENPRTTLSTLSFGDNLGNELFPEQCLGTGLEGAGWGHPRQNKAVSCRLEWVVGGPPQRSAP